MCDFNNRLSDDPIAVRIEMSRTGQTVVKPARQAAMRLPQFDELAAQIDHLDRGTVVGGQLLGRLQRPHGHLGALERISVNTVTAGDRLFPEGTGGFDVAGPSMLVLFVFVNGLSGSYALIQSRQLGVTRRMLSTPTSSGAIIFGEAVGRFVIGLVQAIYIVAATALLFGMEWGGILGAGAVVIGVAAVSAAAAMIFGTFFSNPEQASGLGVVVALVLGAIGGAMMPIELFSDTLASVARFTPHYWAIDAFAELVRHDGGIADVAGQVAILFGIAALLLLVASWRMRHVLTRTR